ncbi:hypothetical protein QCA50_008029 [Cerrena zonata]|uniref:Uncharacterized protein n=1 Tax=Cerrena zonata TaxID=2478898 RepID=A0AAW0G580_9APHY
MDNGSSRLIDSAPKTSNAATTCPDDAEAIYRKHRITSIHWPIQMASKPPHLPTNAA